jgi:WD40 repeat protein
LITAEWHPIASGVVVISSADKNVRLFDIENGGSELFTLPQVHNGLLVNTAWNAEGSLLCTSSKDKHVRIFGMLPGVIKNEKQASERARERESERNVKRESKLFTKPYDSIA